MQKLYAKFPAQPKPAPVPAASAKPESDAKPAEAKSIPAVALTPFRPYYDAHLRTVKPDSMQKLYDKFPAQPKPAPAPTTTAKPESDAKPVEAKSVPAVALTPFRPYYDAHLRTVKPDSMQKLYNKFPAQPKPVPAPTALAKPESDAKPAEAKSVPAAAPVATHDNKRFSMLPSVGTWLASKPKKMQASIPTAPATAAPAAPASPVATVAPEKFAHRPSVGTWIAPNPSKLQATLKAPAAPAVPTATAKPEADAKPAEAKSVPAVALTPFRPYYEAHLRTVKPDSMQKLYDKFPAQPKPAPAPTASAKPESDAKPVEAKSVPAAARVQFSMLPSVGTWLASKPIRIQASTEMPAAVAPVAPQQSEAPAVSSTKEAVPATKERKPFKQLPSVGTWLAFKPYEQPPIRVLERSHSKLLCLNKEELITGFENEIRKRDEEIARLKSLAA
ncbi:unnamed protein product [Symbiodinium natans]|uniref:Uncharacterized protein n=1 Tax=Symbiodinium natans TaxID=878477 RepID=A0A812U1R4_9DINO|nr:unnamed protein product [Symbiodinium natans]